MTILMILNDAPYGSERTYNGLRLAGSLAHRGADLRIFLMGDAVACAKAGQKVPSGYYNTQNMLDSVIRQGGTVRVCGSCIDARGIKEDELAEGTCRGNLDGLTSWTLEADRVLTF